MKKYEKATLRKISSSSSTSYQRRENGSHNTSQSQKYRHKEITEESFL
jgi:hypothetical protein